MFTSTTMCAKACCAVTQRTASHDQRLFSSSCRLMAAGDDGSSRSSASTFVVFDAEPDSDATIDSHGSDRGLAGRSSALAGEQSSRHKILFERSTHAEALGFWRYKHFKLPGDVTFGDEYMKLIVPSHRRTFSALDNFKRSPDLARSEQLRQMDTVRQFDTTNHYSSKSVDFSNPSGDQAAKHFKFIKRVHCTAQECPFLIRKDFIDSFPDVNLRNEQSLTVISISAKYCPDDFVVKQSADDYNDTMNHPIVCDNSEKIRASAPLHCSDPSAVDSWPTTDGERALSRFAGVSIERCGSCTIVSAPSCQSSTSNHSSTLSSVAKAGGLVFTSASTESSILKFVLNHSATAPSSDDGQRSPTVTSSAVDNKGTNVSNKVFGTER